MSLLRRLFFLIAVVALVGLVGYGHAQTYTQAYTQVVIFGDSLSDTGNFANVTNQNFALRYPGPLFNYADGRFTDSTATTPATRLYNGVWLEQLAATLTPVPVIKDSLDGGTDYAYGDATNAPGTQTIVEAGLSVTILNVGGQIAAYLATKPVITPQTLFVVWGGSNDLFNAGSAPGATPATIAAATATAVQQALANVQTLIAAGATQFILPNLAPLGAVPELNTSPASAAAATAAAVAYNSALATGIASLRTASPSAKLYALDTYSLYNAILVSPAVAGLADVKDSAQGTPAVNPDTYLFWDDVHPTTYGHYLLSRLARNLLTQSATASTTLALSTSSATPSQALTLTAKAVSPVASVLPTGLFTFYQGTTPLATVVLDGTGTATAPITAAAVAGTYALTAQYSGDGTFFSATTAPATLTVATAAYTFTASPSTVTVVHGSTATTTLTLTPSGNLTGTFTPACGTLPTYVTCSFSPATLTAANNTAVSTTLSFSTASTAAADIPVRPGAQTGLQVFAAFSLFGGLTFLTRRRKALRPALLSLAALCSLAGIVTLSGCSSGPASTPGSTGHTAAAGTYQIPVNLTPTVVGSPSSITVTLVIQ